MDAILGQNLTLLLMTGEDSEIMNISGSVTDISTGVSAGSMMKTHLTLINTSDGDKLWDLTRIANPGKVIVKCQHCGQWAAKKTACKHCGGPV